MKLTRSRFTLIEMMAVVVIIAILVGITIVVLPMVNRRYADAQTTGTIKALEVALEMYKEKYGFYPISGETWWEENKENLNDKYYLAKPTFPAFYLDKVNSDDNGDASSQNIKNNFCQFINYEDMAKRGTEVSGRIKVLDYYGEPIYYVCPGHFNKESYDIGSKGSNLKFGTGVGRGDAKTSLAVWNESDGWRGNDKNVITDNPLYFGLGDDITNFKRK